MSALSRTLGPFGASAIGVASMVGAGIFYVFAPATALAGSWVLLALVFAGLIAILNALSMAQLSLHHPGSGGAYSFATRYISGGVGFLAGWLFLAGKTASVAAIALIAATYLVPDYAPFVAALLIAIFAGLNISGVRTTAWVSMGIATVVVVTLLAVSGTTLAGGGLVVPTQGSFAGVLQASGLLFFAFAGYARMATLGDEVKNPQRVLPRVIIGTLIGVLALYALVGFALLWGLGAQELALSQAPVAQLAPQTLRGAVVGVAVLASLGSLMTVLAALSRVSMAMAVDRNLPRMLARIWPRTATPAVAEAAVAILAIVVALTLEPLVLVGASAGSVLLYYAIAHWSALAQPVNERVIWRGLPVAGLLVCVFILVTLPSASFVTTLIIAGFGVFVVLLRLVIQRSPS